MQTVTRNRETGKFERTYSCDSCQMLSINGRPCHETGCPASWRDVTKECFECGYEFQPEGRNQRLCADCIENQEDRIAELEEEFEGYRSEAWGSDPEDYT